MSELGWSDGRLAEEARLAYNTVAEFLAGKRQWPRTSTRRSIEAALGWKPGAMERIAEAVPEPASLADQTDDSATDQWEVTKVLIELPSAVTEGMPAAALAEAKAEATRAYLRTLREIRAVHAPPA